MIRLFRKDADIREAETFESGQEIGSRQPMAEWSGAAAKRFALQHATILVADEGMTKSFPRAGLRIEQMTRGIRALGVDAGIVVMRPQEHMAARVSEQF